MLTGRQTSIFVLIIATALIVYPSLGAFAQTITPNRKGLTVIDFVGDVVLKTGGSKVHNALVKDNPNQIYIVGDLGYKSTINSFVAEYKDLGLGNFNNQATWVPAKTKCLIGNHDTDEDGNSNIKKQTHLLCGEFWYYKNSPAKTLVLGYNSNNPDLSKATAFFHKVMKDQTIMQDVKNIDLVSHKPCYVFPNAHHKVESKVKAVCEAFKKDVPQGSNVNFISAHNHDNAKTIVKVQGVSPFKTQNFVAGGGGKTKYPCGTGGDWYWCNDHDAYLRQTINNTDGRSTFNFIGMSGSILDKK